jgi:hypothetical protein
MEVTGVLPTRPLTSTSTSRVQSRGLGSLLICTIFIESTRVRLAIERGMVWPADSRGQKRLSRSRSQRWMHFERQGRPSTSAFPSALPQRCARPTQVRPPSLPGCHPRLTRATVAKIDAVQAEYSAFETLHEADGLIDAARELGVVYVAYSPLGHGWLVDNFEFQSPDDFAPDDFRRKGKRVTVSPSPSLRLNRYGV